MFTTPQDLFKQTTEYFAKFPKTQEEISDAMKKAQKVVKAEMENGHTAMNTFIKASRGNATMNELAMASKQAQQFAIAARFAAFMAMPGSIFVLPAAIKAAEQLDIEFVPVSVAKEFKLK